MRLFLALELAPALRAALAGVQRELQGALPGWRWTRPAGIHLTLRFLGEVEPAREAASREGWRAAAARCLPLVLGLGGVGTFPATGRPRVLWVGVRERPGGALAALAGDLEEAARNSGFAAETRPFRPHLTLARAPRDGGRLERPDPPPPVPPAESAVDALTLYHSSLGPGGARYTALSRYPLGGAPRAAAGRGRRPGGEG